jgi:c-di-GMP-related signal transduction protein
MFDPTVQPFMAVCRFLKFPREWNHNPSRAIKSYGRKTRIYLANKRENQVERTFKQGEEKKFLFFSSFFLPRPNPHFLAL